jgi:hypothetical protein
MNNEPQLFPTPKPLLIPAPEPEAPTLSLWIVAAFYTGGAGRFWSILPAHTSPRTTLESAIEAANELGTNWHHRRVYEIRLGTNIEEVAKRGELPTCDAEEEDK